MPSWTATLTNKRFTPGCCLGRFDKERPECTKTCKLQVVCEYASTNKLSDLFLEHGDIDKTVRAIYVNMSEKFGRYSDVFMALLDADKKVRVYFDVDNVNFEYSNGATATLGLSTTRCNVNIIVKKKTYRYSRHVNSGDPKEFLDGVKKFIHVHL